MKNSLKYIKAIVVLALLFFLFSFSAHRNEKRKIREAKIEYTNGKDLFITPKTVNNLLIVKQQDTGKTRSVALDLNSLENKLNENPMIANAEVYMDVTKQLGVKITQKEPIARVMGKSSFYIDKKGGGMPLSDNFTARVPLVIGVADSLDIAAVYPLLQKIGEDGFLSKQVVSIEKKKSDLIVRLRKTKIKVNFGKAEDLDNKILSLKAFYKKAMEDDFLDKYTLVNLKFRNQVVCTKNEA